MKKLLLICLIFLLAQTFCFSAPPSSIEKDVKQNTKDIKFNEGDIKKNIRNIDKNADAIDVNTDGVKDNKDAVEGNSGAINALNNRVNELAETQEIVSGQIRIHDSQKWEVTLFADYSLNRNTVDRTGIQIKYKFGKSYEEKRLDELEERLNNLED